MDYHCRLLYPHRMEWSLEQKIELMLDLLKAPLLGHWSSPSQQWVTRTQQLSTEIQKGR